MKLSNRTPAEPTLGAAAWGLRELPLEPQLRLVRQLGLTSLELGIANAPMDLPADASEEAIERVSALYEKYGIELFCAATGTDFTVSGEELRAQAEKIQAVIRLCGKLRIRVLRIFCGFKKRAETSEECVEKLVSTLMNVQETAEMHGVMLAVETHGAVEPFGSGVRHFRSLTTQAEDLLALLDRTGHKIKLVFDPANLTAVGETGLCSFWQAVRQDTAYIHLKDFKADASGALHPTAFGCGDTDWTGLAGALRDSGLPAFFEYENCPDIEEGLKKCCHFWNEIERTEGHEHF